MDSNAAATLVRQTYAARDFKVHLVRIFEKLGADNRHADTVTALACLSTVPRP